MAPLFEGARRLLPGLWAGFLLCVAAVATPAAFAVLLPADAGRVAARILAQEASVSLVVGALLLALERARARRAAAVGQGSQFSTGMVLALGAVFCTVLGYHCVQTQLPAARLGQGLFLDHGTGIVIGETAVVGDDVSMLHSVTLGGTGAERGDRHPKIGKGVLLGAGAKVLGNIHIGDYAKVASGSVVLKPVPSGCTVAGVPARLVNCPTGAEPARTMDHTLAEVVYDFVI